MSRTLAQRLQALDEAVELSRDRSSAEAVAHAAAVVKRAGERGAFSGDHTVVALAGATGLGTWVSTSLDQASQAQPVSFAPAALRADSTQSRSWHTGDVTVDLRDTRNLSGGFVQLQVDRGALTVLLPKGTWTSVHTELWAGQNLLDPVGPTVGDVQIANSTWTELNPPENQDTSKVPLSLDLRVHFGQINVIEES